jgi:Spy/CpxP family protein refolding chaperone
MAQNTPAPAPAATPAGAAQRPMLTPQQRADKQTTMMQKNLSLSDDQVTKVKQVNLDYWTQVDKLRSNNTNQQDMHTQMKTLRDKRDADLKAVLTPDQYTKMQTMQAGRPRPGGTPPAPPQPNSN